MSLDSKPTTAAYYALRDVIKEIRPDWSLPGIEAAMKKAQDRPQTFTFGQLARAFVVIAADPSTRTPALLAFDGGHWSAADGRSQAQRERDDLFARAAERLNKPVDELDWITEVSPDRWMRRRPEGPLSLEVVPHAAQ